MLSVMLGFLIISDIYFREKSKVNCDIWKECLGYYYMDLKYK